jgi:ABC-type sugar transport system permease subunit
VSYWIRAGYAILIFLACIAVGSTAVYYLEDWNHLDCVYWSVITLLVCPSKLSSHSHDPYCRVSDTETTRLPPPTAGMDFPRFIILSKFFSLTHFTHFSLSPSLSLSIFATIYIILTNVFIGVLIARIGELILQRKSELRKIYLLNKDVDVSYMISMDHNGDGKVDVVEFLTAMLVQYTHLDKERDIDVWVQVG